MTFKQDLVMGNSTFTTDVIMYITNPEYLLITDTLNKCGKAEDFISTQKVEVFYTLTINYAKQKVILPGT